MLSLLVLLFPLLLMAFMLLMERVEDPLRHDADEDRVAEFLETAQADEVDTLVREGFANAFARWRHRRRHQLTRLLPLPSRTGSDR
ncbi:MAG TPA: hypothetical protein VHX59_05135 [Mycobacteriales bacterium]|jgi:hypothetical protein|nr:hypothetical protein [Mycobacteriales bacterium]